MDHYLKLHRFSLRQFVVLVAVFLCFKPAFADSDDQKNARFDHLAETGFELTAVHRVAECTDCHIFGTFEGTPRTCRGCHGSQGIRTASRKGAMHILSTDNCENCHMTSTANSWVPVRRVDHLEVRGACYRCHNGVIAGGKSPNHIRTTNQCDACHRNTRSWQNVPFVDHAEIPEAQAGICAVCHFTRSPYGGKDPDHIRTTNNCFACHKNTRSWASVSIVDHTEIPEAQAGQCIVCHFNGSPYGGRNPGHIRGGIDSTTNCVACHATVGNWPVKRMDHTEIQGTAGIPGAGSNCSACHESIRPPAPHPPPPLDCGTAGCHSSTTAWCSGVGFSIPGLCN